LRRCEYSQPHFQELFAMSIFVRLPREQYQSNPLAGLSPGGFTLPNAGAAAWLAQLSYEDEPEKIESIATQWHLQIVSAITPLAATILPLPHTRGLVLEGSGIRFVVFAGTDPFVLANWVSDFDFPIEGGIHKGFAQALEAAWPTVKSALTQSGAAARVWFVGHSLGAALAALAAKRANNELGTEAEAIYTFGMPRAGDATFAAAYEQVLGARTFRLVHGDDIVASVPPAALHFRHVGRLLQCARFDQFRGMPAATASDTPDFRSRFLTGFKDALLGLFSGVLAPEIRRDAVGESFRVLPPGIGDHLPDRYLRALGLPPILDANRG
jgi:triacylglycerol lipase